MLPRLLSCIKVLRGKYYEKAYEKAYWEFTKVKIFLHAKIDLLVFSTNFRLGIEKLPLE